MLADLLATIWTGEAAVLAEPTAIDVVGHRVVHGGEQYATSVVLSAAVVADMESLSVLAPLHNPVNLAGIRVIQALLGESVPQVAVFDTAFHATLPVAAATYALPALWRSRGVRRYGFHGTSHRYCTERAAQLLGCAVEAVNLITCHLGNGSSLAAIRGGQSVDTTMGFTPLEGLVMGSRCGALDPGVVLYLLRQGLDLEALDHLLNQESGLLGLSGISSDLRQVLASDSEAAQLAIATFVHSIRRHLGAMLASVPHVDALVFTGGIGENAVLIREQVCHGWPWLALDPAANHALSGDRDIATATSASRVLVIHTQEDWLIAQECWRLMQ